jgi:hypothetical protein
MPRSVLPLALLLLAAPTRAQSIEKPELPSPLAFKMSVTIKPVEPSALMMPLYTSFAGLTAADGSLTWLAVHRGAVEANRFVAPIAGDAAGLSGLKVATGAVTLLAVEQLRRDHPRAAMWMMIAVNGTLTWVVWHNSQVAGLRP